MSKDSKQYDTFCYDLALMSIADTQKSTISKICKINKDLDGKPILFKTSDGHFQIYGLSKKGKWRLSKNELSTQICNQELKFSGTDVQLLPSDKVPENIYKEIALKESHINIFSLIHTATASSKKLLYQTVDNYLGNLKSNDVTKQLEAHNKQGNTPLYVAIYELGDIELVKVLLSFGAPIGEKDITEKLSEKPEIITLVQTRIYWREMAKKMQIPFERTLRLIEQGIRLNTKRTIENNDGVIFFGRTGHGKSTLVNYLCGTNYVLDSKTRDLKLADKSKELAKVGKTVRSQTSFPEEFPLKTVSNNTLLIDMPGFMDTRGYAHDIAASAYIQFLMKRLKKIRCIVFLCQWSDLMDDSKGNGYRDMAKNLGKIFLNGNNNQSAENLILVITKSDLSSSNKKNLASVIERLEEIREDVDDNPTDNHDSDSIDKKAIQIITHAILDRQALLCISDLTTDSFRKNVCEMLKTFVPKSGENFNFSNFLAKMGSFILFAEFIAKQYNNMKNKIRHIASEIIALNDDISVFEKSIGTLTLTQSQTSKEKKIITHQKFNHYEELCNYYKRFITLPKRLKSNRQ